MENLLILLLTLSPLSLYNVIIKLKKGRIMEEMQKLDQAFKEAMEGINLFNAEAKATIEVGKEMLYGNS